MTYIPTNNQNRCPCCGRPIEPEKCPGCGKPMPDVNKFWMEPDIRMERDSVLAAKSAKMQCY